MLTQIRHLHIATHLEVLNALLEVRQMVNERPVEVLTLMHVVFEVCLTHEREVQLGEESLATWVDLGRLLQELERLPSLGDCLVRGLDHFLLLVDFSKLIRV